MKSNTIKIGMLLAVMLLTACSNNDDKDKDISTVDVEANSESVPAGSTMAGEDDGTHEAKLENDTAKEEALLIPGKYVLADNADEEIYIKIYEDMSFTRFEGRQMNRLRYGTYKVDGDMVTLSEQERAIPCTDGVYSFTEPATYRFRIVEDGLAFVKENSDNFNCIKLSDGSLFTYAEELERDSATINSISDILEYKLPDGCGLEEMCWLGLDGMYGSPISMGVTEDIKTDVLDDTYYSYSGYSWVGGIGFGDNCNFVRTDIENDKLVGIETWLEESYNCQIDETHLSNEDFDFIVRDYTEIDVDGAGDYYTLDTYGENYFAYFTDYKGDTPDIYFFYLSKEYFSKEEFIDLLMQIKRKI